MTSYRRIVLLLARVLPRLAILSGTVAGSTGCDSCPTADEYADNTLGDFSGESVKVTAQPIYGYSQSAIGVLIEISNAGDGGCKSLPADTTAALNGSPVRYVSRGGIESSGSGFSDTCPTSACSPPMADIDLPDLLPAMDGNIAIASGAESISIDLRNLVAERIVTPLTSTTVTPGGTLAFDWRPMTDLLRESRASVERTGGYGILYPAFTSRIDGTTIYVDVPSDTEPGTFDLWLKGFADIPILGCNGLAACVANTYADAHFSVVVSP